VLPPTASPVTETTEPATTPTTKSVAPPPETRPPTPPRATERSPTPSRTPTADPTRAPQPSPTTSVATTPLQVGLAISGTPDATTIGVDARSEGTTGDLELTVSVPAGVTLRGATGDWTGCRQSGRFITCSARSGTGHWSGTLVTEWADGAAGRVTAEVDATYRSGGHVTASAGANWPP
jgi:hypothetical protein